MDTTTRRSLQEVGQLKESLIEQRDELNKRMSLVNAKEEELMNGESSKEDNTKNNKVETKESLAKKTLMKAIQHILQLIQSFKMMHFRNKKGTRAQPV